MRTEDFKEFIKTAKKFRKANSSLSYEDNILFEGNKLTTFGTKTDEFIFTTMDADHTFEKPFILPFLDLEKIINKIKDSSISFEIKENKVDVITENGTFTFITDDPKDYKRINHKEQFYCDLDSNSKYLLGKAVNYTKKDLLVPYTNYTNYVLFTKSHIVATTSHKICFYEQEKDVNQDIHIISDVAKHLTGVKEDVQLYLGEDKYIVAKYSGVSLYFKDSDHKFPNWESVIPQNNNIKVEVSTDKLVQALESSSIVMPFNNRVGISVKDNGIKVFTENIEYNKSFSQEVKAITDGDIEIYFNCTHLLESIKTEKTKNTVLTFSNPNKGFILNNCVLIMPML